MLGVLLIVVVVDSFVIIVILFCLCLLCYPEALKGDTQWPREVSPRTWQTVEPISGTDSFILFSQTKN